MAKDKKQRIVVYRNFQIVQTVEWKHNPYDGDGYEVRTTIKEIPKYSGFAQLNWLPTDQQKKKLISEVDSAKYYIDSHIESQEPTIFDELGFEIVKYKNVGIKHG